MSEVFLVGFNKFDDLTKKEGHPDDFYKLTFTKFADNGQSLQKWEMDIHNETFKKIIGTTEPKWKTVKKIDGKWISQ